MLVNGSAYRLDKRSALKSLAPTLSLTDRH